MPRIVYLSFPAAEISGGIKTAFQHVELLVEAGLQAIVATPDGIAPTWFDSPLPVMTLDQISPDDVLVFPENNAGMLARFAQWPNRKLVFCQSWSLIYQGVRASASYADSGVTHLMCASHTVMHYCRRRFPGLKLGYTPFFIDSTLFSSLAPKKLQVLAVPRKRVVEYGAILDLFRAVYPQYRSIDWGYLHHATQAQVAQVMGESAVFLSLGRLEAHGMTALEAMASGCIVAGFCGVVGGSDSATARNGFWAAEDDVIGCVEQLGRAVQLAIDRGPTYEAMVQEGRQTAFEYRREAVSQRLLDFWRLALADFGY